MRLIAMQIAKAIKAGKSKKVGNTVYDHEAREVRLYGHRILYQVNNRDWCIDWSVCHHWPTTTTCSRVNDIVNLMTNYGMGTRLCRKNFTLQASSHMGDIPWANSIATGDPIAFKL